MIRTSDTTEAKLPRDRAKRLVLFHRDFRKFSGGHLKVWNYFNHVLASGTHEPRIAFTPESKWDETNPWATSTNYVTAWKPGAADILFLAGIDWKALPKNKAQNFTKPVINLIQHPRHADPKDELHRFLENRAIRICVSQQVADAIKSTGKINGPMSVIANGIDLGQMPAAKPHDQRSVDVLICGNKAPQLARKVEKVLVERTPNVVSLVDWVPRTEYLSKLNEAKIAVMLPRPLEGFYLPALEAMACGGVVVCPDCFGNRDFCLEGINCFRPDYDAGEIISATMSALRLADAGRSKMLGNAQLTVRTHSLDNERASFLQILERADELWHSGRSPGATLG